MIIATVMFIVIVEKNILIMLFCTVCSYYFTYVFQSESALCICLNVKELVA